MATRKEINKDSSSDTEDDFPVLTEKIETPKLCDNTKCDTQCDAGPDSGVEDGSTKIPTEIPTGTPCCESGCPCDASQFGTPTTTASSTTNSPFDILMTLMPLLTPLMTSYLSKPTTSNTGKCPVSDNIIDIFGSLWDGLDHVSNKKLRAICFLNNLNKFHATLMSKIETHCYSSNLQSSNDKLVPTVFSLTCEKLRNEICNVMEAIQ